MKLIKAIPTKTIFLHNLPYEVYEPVRIGTVVFKDTGYQQDRLELSFGNRYRVWSITPFKRSVEPARTYLCRQNDRRIVDEANRFVERHYSPREYSFTPSKGVNVIAVRSKNDSDVYILTVRVMNASDADPRYSFFDIGEDGYITEDEIKQAIDKAMAHRVAVCEELNVASKQKRDMFRQLVKKQIAERDRT